MVPQCLDAGRGLSLHEVQTDSRLLPDGADPGIIRTHIDAMLYGGITVGIASWWGQGHQTDKKVATLLQQANGTGFKWTFYYEPEGTTTPPRRS